MPTRLAVRLYAFLSVALVCAGSAATASAQFRPRPIGDPSVGEQYHIEVMGALWWPGADVTVASSGSGILTGIGGTDIDLKRDLGATDQRFPEIAIVLKPASSHKLRFHYIPINYTQQTTITRDIRFNGQTFSANIPVNSSLDWKAYRFGYEYDFLTHNNWFAGFILEAKYTDASVNLAAPVVGSEFARAQVPFPAIGGIGRYYVIPNASITAEVTAFKLPTVQGRYEGHYVDVDIYGTYNVTRNVGAQLGYRSMDFGFLWKQDTGSMTLNGVYLAIVARY